MPSADEPSFFTPAPLPVAPLDDAGRLACLRLIRSSNIGPVTFRKLINRYGGAQNALDALQQRSGSARGHRPIKLCPVDRAEAELEAALKTGAQPVFTIEPGYPAALAMTDAPPPMLYVRGKTDLLNTQCLAIVGSRRPSAAGVKLARTLAAQLADQGLCIVSGLARGIDAAAHTASLDRGTIAVVAGGIDVIYPPEHAELQNKIIETGAVISEMPPGFVPRGADFPRRNRIIAGLSLGVVVVEAARKSGSLVTARLAGEIGREVFAVPGHPLDPRAEGTLRLLKDGATIATMARDVLDVLKPICAEAEGGLAERNGTETFHPPVQTEFSPPEDDDAERVLAALGPTPIEMDELARATGLSVRAVRSIVFELDLSGHIEHQGQQLVALRTSEGHD